MNIAGFKPKIKVVPSKVTTVRVQETKKLAPLPSKAKAESAKRHQAQRARDSPTQSRGSPSTPRSGPATPNSDWQDSTRLKVKRKPSRSHSPAQQRLVSSDEDDSDNGKDSGIENPPAKKQKLGNSIDVNRRLRSRKAFSDSDDGVFTMIHAADLPSGQHKTKLGSDTAVGKVIVELQYPSASQRERYKLLFPKDEIDPVVDIIQIVKTVTDVYLKDKQKLAFTDPNTGIIRQLEKAGNNLKKNKTDQVLLDIFKKAVDAYNSAITDLIKDGALAENLDSIHHLPLAMVRVILNQVYERAVSPTIEDLSKYTNGTDEVYGELLPPFVSRVLGEVGLKSDEVFIDLGSGVGNVVLQAALEFGCESWGCEMMVNACNLAQAQQKEFAARCRLWGLQSGEVHLERGNFLENTKIHKAMQRADVILVNNEVFQETTNRDLVHLFLDLKDGCKIVSLKPFLAVSRNKNDPANILEIVEKGDIYSEDVSWTARGQNYYISTKDSGRLQASHD